MLRSEQIRAGRVLLGWRQEDLATAAGIGIATIRRLESSQGPVQGNISTLSKIQQAFERAGVKFIEADGAGGIGVRLASTNQRKSKRKKSIG